MTGAPDGHGRMTGAPRFTLLHVGSGFANSIAMLHNAGRANTPIVNVVGANASLITSLATAQVMSDFPATLQPKTDAQKQALATANHWS